MKCGKKEFKAPDLSDHMEIHCIIQYQQKRGTKGFSNHLKYVHSYSVHVTAQVLATLQFQASKSDVIVRLSIVDQERVMVSKTGKGLVVIPAFYFLANEGEQSNTELILNTVCKRQV